MKDFEERLQKAKEILDKLMKQDITVARSVELYQQGMKLLKEAQELLEKATIEIEYIEKKQ